MSEKSYTTVNGKVMESGSAGTPQEHPPASGKLAVAPTGKKRTHQPGCGDVGDTGEHGDLGSNAACVWVKQLTAIVARQSSILQDQIDKAAAAAATTPSPGASSSIFSPASAGGGIPSWLLYAAGGVLLFKLL